MSIQPSPVCQCQIVKPQLHSFDRCRGSSRRPNPHFLRGPRLASWRCVRPIFTTCKSFAFASIACDRLICRDQFFHSRQQRCAPVGKCRLEDCDSLTHRWDESLLAAHHNAASRMVRFEMTSWVHVRLVPLPVCQTAEENARRACLRSLHHSLDDEVPFPRQLAGS